MLILDVLLFSSLCEKQTVTMKTFENDVKMSEWNELLGLNIQLLDLKLTWWLEFYKMMHHSVVKFYTSLFKCNESIHRKLIEEVCVSVCKMGMVSA